MKSLALIRRLFTLVILITFYSLGCSRLPAQGPTQKSAESFLTAYYQEANLQKALHLSGGFAAQKIQEQLALGGGQASSDNLASREVSFTRLEDPAGEKNDMRRILLYQLTVRSKLMEPINRTIRLTLENLPSENNQSGWKVVNFVES